MLVETTGAAIVIAAGATGNVSVNATPVIDVGVPLVRVNVNVLFRPSRIGLGLNILAMAGTPTDRIAFALVPVPA